MSTVYGAILDEIERADYQVYRDRVRVSFARKLWLALKAHDSEWRKIQEEQTNPGANTGALAKEFFFVAACL